MLRLPEYYVNENAILKIVWKLFSNFPFTKEGGKWVIESDAFFIRHTGEKLNSCTMELAQGEVKVLFQGIWRSYQLGQMWTNLLMPYLDLSQTQFSFLYNYNDRWNYHCVFVFHQHFGLPIPISSASGVPAWAGAKGGRLFKILTTCSPCGTLL